MGEGRDKQQWEGGSGGEGVLGPLPGSCHLEQVSLRLPQGHSPKKC